jgi:adenine-specific DNA-methyltransferase
MAKKTMKKDPVERTSTNITEERLEHLKDLLPEAFSEGKVDFENLRQALGELVDDRPERYSFTWAGKRDAIRLLQTPSQATLIPSSKESVNFDTTQNLFIEGDNLEVLKLLYKPYAGQVKMIYIDPPYNTGNDFVYPDNFADPLDTYLQMSGQGDEEGNLLTTNPETSGRYHSTWLSMMYPRLFVARQLLREDGIIFISIDENEAHNLRLMMNEIFGEENFIAQLIWKKKSGGGSDVDEIVIDHEYILAYGRSQSPSFYLDKNAEVTTQYNQVGEDGRRYSLDRLDKQTLGYLPSLDFPITGEDEQIYRVEHKNPQHKVARWRWSKQTVRERYDELVFKGRYVYTKNYEKEGAKPRSLLVDQRFGRTRTGKTDLTSLFGVEVLEHAKPVRLIKHLCAISTKSSDIVLDFFAGSGTTAQAVLELNREDGGNRHLVLVQLPEPTDEKSSARKEGFTTIAEIGKDRIRRIIDKMRKEREDELELKDRKQPEDLGFKVFKLAESHYRQWSGVEEKDPEKYAKTMEIFTDPLLPGWKPFNIIYEVALKEGYSLTSTIEELKKATDNTVYRVTDPDKDQSFLICLDNELKIKTIKALKLDKDAVFICRDSALTDELAANIALQCHLKTI